MVTVALQGGPLSVLDPASAVLPVIALLGLFPVLFQYRDESRLFVLAYACLAVATLATNLEDLFLGTVLNYVEHFVGLGGSGVAVFLAAYLRYSRVVGDGADGDGGGGEGETVPDGVAADGGREVTADG